MGFFDFFTQKVGIDLGTSNTLVYVNDKGIIINEPSVVAIKTKNNEISAIGIDAKAMLDRTPSSIQAIRPLQNGVIADFEITKAMIKYFVSKALSNKKFIKSNIVICVPVGITTIERMAVEEVALESGARRVKLVEEPMAAAIGAGIKVEEPVGNMVIDIGGGTTEIAVISLGGIVESDSLRIAGDDIDINIRDYIKNKYKIEIGLVTAEQIKAAIGNASSEYYDREHIKKDNLKDSIKDKKLKKEEKIDENEKTEELEESIEKSNEEVSEIKMQDNSMDYRKEIQVRGRDIVSGLPVKMNITSDEIREAILETINNIVSAIKRVLERIPPELSSDLYINGVYLTGGGALLKGFDIYLEKEIGLKVHLANNPLNCVALGAGKICESM